MKCFMFFFKYLKIIILIYYLNFDISRANQINVTSHQTNKPNETFVYADLNIQTSKDIFSLKENKTSLSDLEIYGLETSSTSYSPDDNNMTDYIKTTTNLQENVNVSDSYILENITKIEVSLEENNNSLDDSMTEIIVIQKLDPSFFSKFLRMFGDFNIVRPVFFTNININLSDDPNESFSEAQEHVNELDITIDGIFKHTTEATMSYNKHDDSLEQTTRESTIDATDSDLIDSFETREYQTTRQVLIEKIAERNGYRIKVASLVSFQINL